MNIKITDKNGLILKTAGKLCEEDITVVPDESILGGTTYETYDISNHEQLAGKYVVYITNDGELDYTVSDGQTPNDTCVEYKIGDSKYFICSVAADGCGYITVHVKSSLTWFAGTGMENRYMEGSGSGQDTEGHYAIYKVTKSGAIFRYSPAIID